MALIGKIRKNSWLLIVMIGLGLGGFIIMDMTSGQQSVFGSSQFTMGEIEGEKLDWNQFNRTENLLYGNSGGDVYVRRDALWNYMVEEAIIKKEAEEIGLGVSKTELIDLQFGPNPSPVIQQRFRDPTTQQLNRQQLNEFRTAIENNTLTDPNMRAFWAHQETEIIKDRLQTKLNSLVTKAMYTPTWMAEMGYVDQNQRLEMAYVKVPFDELDNTEVSLSDEDFRNFLENNQAQYEKKEENRQVEYVVFNVQPTAEDSAMWKEEVTELIPEFESTTEDSLFVERNFGTYDPAFVQKSALSPLIADTVFSMPIGSVYGPYMEAGAYKAVKVIDRMIVPDSVRARHILLPASDPTSLMQAQNRIDSLKNLIQTGVATFDSLATKFGTDGTRTKGGDLGYAAQGMMVKPFNDLIFFKAEPGELNTVITQFGVHLVEVTDRKYINNTQGAKVAYIEQALIPSDETQNNLYDDVLEFVGQNRTLAQLEEAVAQRPELSLESSPWLTRNAYTVGNLGPGQASREIVRWAFNGEVGQVSPEIYVYQDQQDYFNSKYVVVGLQEVLESGLPSVDAIRDDIEPQVLNQKKGEMLSERLAGKDLTAVAAEFGVPVDSLDGVSFDQSFITGLGNEPKVIGTAFSLEENEVSEPVIGSTGVFLVKVLTKPQVGAPTNIPQVRQRMSSSLRAQAGVQLMQALRENADIEDNRARFY